MGVRSDRLDELVLLLPSFVSVESFFLTSASTFDQAMIDRDFGGVHSLRWLGLLFDSGPFASGIQSIGGPFDLVAICCLYMC